MLPFFQIQKLELENLISNSSDGIFNLVKSIKAIFHDFNEKLKKEMLRE